MMKAFPLAASLAAVAQSLGACSSKPKPVAAVEPTPPALAPEPERRVEAAPTAEDPRALMRQRAGETFQTIYFPYDQAVLDEKAKATLANIRKFMSDYPEVKVKVEGHADERGTPDYNLALGDQRAKAIQDYLHSLGVPKSTLITVSYGEEKPAQEGDNESAYGLNRRAEFQPDF